jgi:nitroimidazol reductase NimA-like FMN-containing flavoprotein (pyridoxamine 5'-phosphate oxidase superfamily)
MTRNVRVELIARREQSRCKMSDEQKSLHKTHHMFGQLQLREVEDVISHQLIARLGCYADGKIYVVPISYAYDGEFIYAFSREGMKVDMMRKNPDVCLQMDNLNYMDNWQSVILWGRFEELVEQEERNDALLKLMSRMLPAVTSEMVRISPHWPFPSDQPENVDGVVYRIRITEKTGRFEKNMAEHFFAY